MGYFCCERFTGPVACISLVGGKTPLYKLSNFLASTELIGFVDLSDSYKIWPKCFLVINAPKGVTPFLIFQILLLLRALMWPRSATDRFAKFKRDFLGNQSEYWKSLTRFCSLPLTVWHRAVCLVVRESRKAGNSVKLANIVIFSFKGMCALLLILHFITFIMTYAFLKFQHRWHLYKRFSGRHPLKV